MSVELETGIEHRDEASVGQRLRQARESKSLSLDQVAQSLRLSVQTIKDLEADDYRHQQAVIYVQGYLRSYARQVGLPENALLAQFSASDWALAQQEKRTKAVKSKQNRSYTEVNEVKNHRRRLHTARGIGVVVALSLLAMVVMWWQGQRADNSVSAISHEVSIMTPQAQVHSAEPTAAQLPLTVKPLGAKGSVDE